MINFFIFCGAFIFLFLFIDLLQKKVWPNKQWSRKATHIGSAIISFYMPVYLTKSHVVGMGALFVVILGVSKWKKILAMHQVQRLTLGEVLYPLAVALMPFICLPESPASFQLGILVLGFSDGLAGVIGEWWNYKVFRLKNHRKSLGGAIVFFLVTFVILFFFVGPGLMPMHWMVVFALALALVELGLVYGTDNLVLPVLVAWAHYAFIV